MRRLWLIAEREFNAYASTASFWLALIAGPLLMALGAIIVAATEHHPAPAPQTRAVEIHADDPGLAAAARRALATAADAGGWRLAPSAVQGAEASILTIRVEGAAVSVTPEGAALPADALARLRGELSDVERAQALRAGGAPEAAIAAAEAVRVEIVRPPKPAAAPLDAAAPGRFAMMVILWMNLAGGLGMLLQAIVRERSNRALESLLAAARPSEIILGKLAGVCAVSLLAVGAWTGAAAGLAALWGSGQGQGAAGQVAALALAAFRDPAALAEACAIYLLTFVLYGSALLGLGAVAKDLPSAQNMMRPIFGLLLIVFFLGMARASGAQGFDALVWFPPITPFLLLTMPADALTAGERALALVHLAFSAAGVAWAASRSLVPSGGGALRRLIKAPGRA